jgi:hypothetical protein
MLRKIWLPCLAGALLLGLAGLMLPAGARAAADLVPFKDLVPFVDLKMPGWEPESKPNGVTMKTDQMKMSQAGATYRSGDKTLEVHIMDGLAAAGTLMSLGQKFEMETGDQYVKTVKIQGFGAWETFDRKEKSGNLMINVAGRFLVTLNGRGLDNAEPLTAAAQQMDLNKLAAMAK